MTAAQEALVRALLATSRAMVGLAVRNLASLDADVTLPQYRTLVVLATTGARRSAELAREMQVAPSTMTRMCDRLVRRDFAYRFHRPGDRRSTWLALTPAGRDLVGEVMRARQRELAAIVAPSGLEATPEVLGFLDRLVEVCGELPDGLWWQRWEAAGEVPLPR